MAGVDRSFILRTQLHVSCIHCWMSTAEPLPQRAGELRGVKSAEGDLLLLAGGYTLLELALWTTRTYQLVFGLLTVAYVIGAVIVRRSSADELGISGRRVRRGWWALVAALTLAAAMVLLSLRFGTMRV